MLQETAKEEGEHPTVYVSDIYIHYCSMFSLCMYVMYVCLRRYIPVCAIYTACVLYIHTCLNVCMVSYPVHEQGFIMCICVCIYAFGWVWIDVCVCVCVHVHMCAWVSVSGNSSNVILVTSIAAPN